MPETPPAERRIVPRTFAHRAAFASWLSPLVGLFLGNFVRRATGVLAWQGLTLPFVALGFALALYALARMRKVGSEGLLPSAVVGLAVNGVLVLLFAMAYQRGRTG